MMGAAIATIAAYSTMFVGMVWWSQRIYPVPVPVASRRHGRRGRGRARRGREARRRAGSPSRSPLALVYPLALLPLGFYLPAERRAIGRRLRLAG